MSYFELKMLHVCPLGVHKKKRVQDLSNHINRNISQFGEILSNKNRAISIQL